LKLFRINSPLTAIRAIVGWPVFMIGLFFLAAWIGSSIPANSSWRQPEQGIEIFVESNGIHVSLIVPISAAGEDLSDLIRPEHLVNRGLYGTYAMIGWGHQGVYRRARTWGDVRSGDIVSAITGSDSTTLHVYHLTDPVPLVHRKMLRVSPAQYRSIITQIRATFRLTARGASIAYPAYAADNLFYDARGHYSAFHTCNTWTGAVLKNAGVKIGIWTPLPGGVMRWF
jgi:uncharacterized protein (TIGR02117 family)